MRTIIILLISMAALLPATESNPRVARVIDSFTESSDAAQAAYAEGLRKLEEERVQALNRAREHALRDLKRLVNRRSDFAEQAQIYTQVLRLDREDEDAVRFFTAIGTLDNVLEGLEPLVETDLLGNVVDIQGAATNSGLAAIEFINGSNNWQEVPAIRIRGVVQNGRGNQNMWWVDVPESLIGKPYLIPRHGGSGQVHVRAQAPGRLIILRRQGVSGGNDWDASGLSATHDSVYGSRTWDIFALSLTRGQQATIDHGPDRYGTIVIAENLEEVTRD